MIIERVEINNYRSLKKVDLHCDELVAILGRNGAGKSSLLHALDVFYNVSAQLTEFDYFEGNTDSEIKITVTYCDLREDELEEFESFLVNGKLTVSKVITSGGSKYFGASRQIPEFHELRALSAVPKKNGLNSIIDERRFPDLGARVTTQIAADELMNIYEASHPELTQLFEREQQFVGPRNIGGGKLDKFTKFVLVPAVRDAASEADRKGAILQLVDLLVLRSINARADVRMLNEEFEKRIREVYSAENLTELAVLAERITDALTRFAPGAALYLDFDEIVPPKIALPNPVPSLVEDSFKCPISYSGHGLQRALIFALLQQLSLTSLKRVGESDVATPVETPGNLRIPDLILAIEEPELYQHPSRSRFLSNVLSKLATTHVDPTEPRTQVLYATHSPYFINIANFDYIRVVRKVSADGTDTLQSKVSSFSKVSAAQRLREITQNEDVDFTAESFIAHAGPVMTSIVNEGFFADVVVVVEGLSEIGALWAIQEIRQLKWDALNIVLVSTDGKTKIDRPVVVFRGLEIPTYFIFDGDSRHTGGDREKSNTKNAEYLRLAGANVVEFPESQVNETWAVFNDELEAELRCIGEDEFDRIRQETANELGYDQSSKILKNSEGAYQFIKRVYECGFKVEILDEIATRITALKESSKGINL